MAKVIIIFGNNKHIKDFFLRKKSLPIWRKESLLILECQFNKKNPLQCAETNRKYCKGDI